jgi:nucleoside-diphosphate-sugar epimerase
MKRTAAGLEGLADMVERLKAARAVRDVANAQAAAAHRDAKAQTLNVLEMMRAARVQHVVIGGVLVVADHKRGAVVLRKA